MKSMTCEQAYNFVLAGYFPDSTDINAIVDLQDVFGHLPYSFNIALLNTNETSTNALKLFRSIWDTQTVDSMMRSVASLSSNMTFKNTLEESIREAELKIEALTNRIKCDAMELSRVKREIDYKSQLFNVDEWLPGGKYNNEE